MAFWIPLLAAIGKAAATAAASTAASKVTSDAMAPDQIGPGMELAQQQGLTQGMVQPQQQQPMAAQLPPPAPIEYLQPRRRN